MKTMYIIVLLSLLIVYGHSNLAYAQGGVVRTISCQGNGLVDGNNCPAHCNCVDCVRMSEGSVHLYCCFCKAKTGGGENAENDRVCQNENQRCQSAFWVSGNSCPDGSDFLSSTLDGSCCGPKVVCSNGGQCKCGQVCIRTTGDRLGRSFVCVDR